MLAANIGLIVILLSILTGAIKALFYGAEFSFNVDKPVGDTWDRRASECLSNCQFQLLGCRKIRVMTSVFLKIKTFKVLLKINFIEHKQNQQSIRVCVCMCMCMYVCVCVISTD